MKDKPLSFAMPQNACNSHLHIIDPTFPNDGKAEIQIGTVETYRKLADELGLPRAIFVQAKPFALDNSCLLDAIERFGSENCRGIAVVNNTVSDEELERLHHGAMWPVFEYDREETLEGCCCYCESHCGICTRARRVGHRFSACHGKGQTG